MLIKLCHSNLLVLSLCGFVLVYTSTVFCMWQFTLTHIIRPHQTTVAFNGCLLKSEKLPYFDCNVIIVSFRTISHFNWWLVRATNECFDFISCSHFLSAVCTMTFPKKEKKNQNQQTAMTEQKQNILKYQFHRTINTQQVRYNWQLCFCVWWESFTVAVQLTQWKPCIYHRKLTHLPIGYRMKSLCSAVNNSGFVIFNSI